MATKIPNPTLERKFITYGIFYAALSFALFLVVRFFDLWSIFHVQEMNPDFADLRSIFSARDCLHHFNLFGIYELRCDIWKRPFNYPISTIATSYVVHFNQKNLWLLGIFMAFLLSCSLAYWFYLAIKSCSNFYTCLIFGSLFLSPSIFLLEERGNYDSIIFVLFTSGFVLLRKGNKKSSIVLFFLCGLLKVYLIPINLVLGVLERNLVRRKINFSFFLINLILVLPFLSRLIKNTPVSPSNSFGFMILLGQTNNQYLRWIFALMIAVLFFYLTRYIYLKGINCILFGEDSFSNINLSQYLCTLGAFFVPYFALISFNYRIIFLLPLVALNFETRTASMKILSALLVLVIDFIGWNPLLSYSLIMNALLFSLVVTVSLVTALNLKNFNNQ
jgi:hypothetical protein